MNILVACEYSGVVRRAFARRGHSVWSCDLLPSDDDSAHHIIGDVSTIINRGWDLLIGHPPCTYMANSGVSHLVKKDPITGDIIFNKQRYNNLIEATNFFLKLYNANVAKIAIENPIMHKYAKGLIGVQQSQVIQPWMFGHMEQKATCLWLRGLPLLQETSNVKKEMLELPSNVRQRLHFLPPSKDRWKIRSRTFDGIANAMAEQWG